MAKRIQASDIVPTQVLFGIAERVRTAAAKIAKQKRAPLKSSRAGGDKYSRLNIGISQPKITQGQISVNLSMSNVALAFEYGSKPHSIDPRNKRALWFPYPAGKIYKGVTKYVKNGVMGITTKHVDHLGFDAKPFLAPAKRATRKQNLEDISKASLANLRLIIAAEKRVV